LQAATASSDNMECSLEKFSALNLEGAAFDFREELSGDLQWNLHALLRRFVDNPWALRMVLCETDAVIAGGLPTQFLARQTWEESDMDIFVGSEPSEGDREFVQSYGLRVRKAASREERVFLTEQVKDVYDVYRAACEDKLDVLRTFFVESEGYQLVTGGSDTYDYRGFEVVNLERGTQRVQLITVPFHNYPVGSIEGVLRYFDFTAAMNFITWEGVVSLFPRLTFVDRNMVLVDTLSRRTLEKYEQRGWSALPCQDAGESVNSFRELGDDQCWLMVFDGQGSVVPDGELTLPSISFAVSKGSRSRLVIV
jgi:hypothetical protein